MKILMHIFFLMIITISCSGYSGSEDLTWYDHSAITQVTEDPDRPEEFVRVSIGISLQVFNISKKSADYKDLLEKALKSSHRNKGYNIGIENKTNIIREMREAQ